MATYEELIAKSRELAAAGDTESAKRVAKIALSQRDAKAKPETNIVEQTGSGLNEGLASFAGTPVSIAEMVLNGLIPPTVQGGIGPDGKPQITSIGQPQFQGSVGGPETFLNLLYPVISDVAPQTGPQRFMRRVGQEVGYGVPAAMTGAALSPVARAYMPAYMGASLAGDVGSGIAGQTSQEVAPGNQTMDMIASLLGGVTVGGLGALATPRIAAVPSIGDMKAMEAQKWAAVKAAPETLTDQATAGLEASARRALPTSQLAPEAYPNAFSVADKMQVLKNPTIYDVEEARRIIGDRVAADPKEARVGVKMKKEIEDYLSGLTTSDLQGGNADQTLADLATARKTTHQVKKAETILNKEMRGETRAATTGTGGNEVNATRQNIRTVYDKERDPTLSGKRQGFTPDEMAAMSRVVTGDAKSNIARLLGRMSPTSGALPLMMMGGGGISGATAAMTTGNPLFAIPMIGAGVGMAAKSAAESMTQSNIDRLVATILNNGKAPGKSAARSAAEAAIVQQLLSTGVAGAQ
jgi:hypothetical protein